MPNITTQICMHNSEYFTIKFKPLKKKNFIYLNLVCIKINSKNMLELRSNIYITISISSHFKVCSFIFKVFLIKLKKHKNLSLNLSKFLHIKTNIQTSYEWFSVGFPFSGVFSYPSATPLLVTALWRHTSVLPKKKYDVILPSSLDEYAGDVM